ncbi:MAG TPA: vWA domain-containing protein, partial [Polyangiaceae bacterium]|nr:vWA domain-containing protein [Polyangiaceae bacterium]
LLAARQVLLDLAAALPLHPRGVSARSRHVARQIAWLDRLQAAGLDPDVDLVHQARHAARSGDRHRLHAALRALEEGGDPELAPAASHARRQMCGGGDLLDARGSLRRSAVESFGREVLDAVRRGYVKGCADQVARAEMTYDVRAAKKKLAYLEGGDDATAACALAVDGAFELGAPMTPVRVVEESFHLREVRFPTQTMQLVPAREPEDLHDAVILDPRTLLLDLATGRLLTRRFVRTEVERRARIVMKSEVRVYVLDGSSSMTGPRARMRDAIVLAELATLKKRMEQPGDVRSVLYFRYFDEHLGPTTKVTTLDQVGEAIVTICATVRTGRTDIEEALLASFAMVAEAKQGDPLLFRAHIVLVTDGDAKVDEARIIAARESLHELPIGVSVIALGEENAALRALVARQRARGERTFYHFIDDAELEAIVRGEQLGPSLHIDTGPADRGPPEVRAGTLEREIGPLLDDLERISRQRDRVLLQELDTGAPTLCEAQSSALADSMSEGEHARAEALYKDRLALSRRYARWFPSPSPPSPPRLVERGGRGGGEPNDTIPESARTPEDEEDEEAVFVALSAIAEVIGVVGGMDLDRRADAISLLERLLPDARLTPVDYTRVVTAGGPRIASALRAVHDVVLAT